MPALQRLSAVEKKIKDINSKDIRVSVIGTVIDTQNGIIVIDDGTGKIKITFEQPVNVKLKQLVRVFARVIPSEHEVELQGEILQNMDKLDLNLWNKVNNLWDKLQEV